MFRRNDTESDEVTTSQVLEVQLDMGKIGPHPLADIQLALVAMNRQLTIHKDSLTAPLSGEIQDKHNNNIGWWRIK